jgi:hypothetical protein
VIGRKSLFAAPVAREFNREQESELRAYLRKLETTTSVKEIQSPAELMLDEEGKLPKGFRYTETAFRQVCDLLCKGLSQMTIDMSGVRATARGAKEDSFDGAVEVFNAVLRRRFRTRLAEKGVRVVRDTTPGASFVVGILGPKYYYLENRTVYDMAKEAAASGPNRAQFHEAIIAGRRMILRFAHRKPLFTRPSSGEEEHFYGGYHFSNSEISGEASVRAAVMLLLDPPGSAALGRFGRGRLAHIGKDFGKRLGKMFQTVLSMPQDPNYLRQQIDQLATTPLRVGGPEREHAARIDELTLRLHQQDIPKSVARRIVVAAMTYDGHRRRPVRELITDAIARRTAYDLYSAMTGEAQELPLAVREPVEQAAYGLLTGKITLR